MPPDPDETAQAQRVTRAALARRVFLVASPAALLIVLAALVWLMFHG